MLIPMTLVITGAVPSKFEVNDYKEDCVKVSALVPLDDDVGGIGQGAETFNYKTSQDIIEFDNVGLDKSPQEADCQVEMVKKGKKTVLMLKKVTFKPKSPNTGK